MLDYTNMGVGTVDLNIYISSISSFFELLVGLQENENKLKPGQQCIVNVSECLIEILMRLDASK